ncbi:MFS transporter [Bifidobacterium sp. SO4]|uniref:MFS transporter n=1 Tax=Bifidobacterium sp. SO4 TaxID=2809030 RepID=UPI001BDC8CF5|nr:MFS transporter [Bifidobacterium sp. SO4]MBT1170708.1 MFS transporter [Bifidobacterium sp. SO4]
MTQIAEPVPMTVSQQAIPEVNAEQTVKRARHREYPYDGKTMFGMAAQGLISIAGAALMSAVFMNYLTDYAGIGAWGATLATTVLFAGRIFDAFNDPIEGWIMDSAKTTKHGKYKKFIIASVVISAVSLILLYNIPNAIVSNPLLVGIWVVFFYFAYDVGTSFNAFLPLVQSVTEDDTLRAKFFTVSRIVGTVGAIPMGMVMTLALALGNSMGGIKNAIGILVSAAVIVVGGISLVAICMVKEGHHSVRDEKHPVVKPRDILNMLQSNKALAVNFLACLFFGFTWTLTSAVATYYLKWGYNANLVTGQVDNAQFAVQTLILSAASLVPIFAVTAFSPIMVRKCGSNLKAMEISIAMMIVPAALIFVLQMVGILQQNFWILFLLLFLVNCASGLTFVPGYGLWTECIDYNRYLTGREMGGLVNAIKALLEKGQNAIAGAITGVLLIAIGYNVDSATGAYLGDLSQMPALLDKLSFLMGVVPAVLALLALLVYRCAYPITPEIRAAMRERFDAESALANTTE